MNIFCNNKLFGRKYLMKTIIHSLSLFLLSNNVAQAGLLGITWHSRANCINNESITWDAIRPWRILTISNHRKQAWHFVIAPWKVTRRSAAVHWNEGRSGGWQVHGEHNFAPTDLSKTTTTYSETKYTSTTTCSIIDGWFY